MNDYYDKYFKPGFQRDIWRTADLLGVSSRQRIELRQRVAVERASD